MIKNNNVVMIIPQLQALVYLRIDLDECWRVSIAIEDELYDVEVTISVELVIMHLQFL